MPRCPLGKQMNAVGRPWVLIPIKKRERQQDSCLSDALQSVIRAIKRGDKISLGSDGKAEELRFLKCGFVPKYSGGKGWGGVWPAGSPGEKQLL